MNAKNSANSTCISGCTISLTESKPQPKTEKIKHDLIDKYSKLHLQLFQYKV